MTGAGAIPLVDLHAQHHEIETEVLSGIKAVMEQGSFILGPAVEQFEREFAHFCGVEHCIGVGNGTDAIELMLRALDIGPGDEVLLPANTFIATPLAVLRAGATPVLVDCDEHHLMDVDKTAARLNKRTKAVLPVHLYGQCAAVDRLEAVAAPLGVPILEDAAQSQGARRQGRAAGSLGLAAATSFYPGKNIGAYGDAGAVLTSSEQLASRIRRLRNWGSERKYHHPEIGFNSRLDSLQAVVLKAKLARLTAWNEARRRAAELYSELLSDVSVQIPSALEGNDHVWHLYVVRVPDRDRVLRHLHSEGIGAGVHYPTPVHLHGAMAQLGYQRGDFPVSERASDEILSLPIYPHITEEQQERVASSLRRAIGAV